MTGWHLANPLSRGSSRVKLLYPDTKCVPPSDHQELKAPPALPRADGTTVRPTHLEPDSFFGIYIRQLVLEFHNVVFEGMSNLVSDLQAWVDLEAEDFEGENEFAQFYPPQEIRGNPACGASARMAQEYVQVCTTPFDHELL